MDDVHKVSLVISAIAQLPDHGRPNQLMHIAQLMYRFLVAPSSRVLTLAEGETRTLHQRMML